MVFADPPASINGVVMNPCGTGRGSDRKLKLTVSQAIARKESGLREASMYVPPTFLVADPCVAPGLGRRAAARGTDIL
jgi:hypothetical protein